MTEIDPNYQKELKKYDNPIPSREFIISKLINHTEPVSLRQLYKILNLHEEEQKQALTYRLKAMVRDRQLVLKNINIV